MREPKEILLLQMSRDYGIECHFNNLFVYLFITLFFVANIIVAKKKKVKHEDKKTPKTTMFGHVLIFFWHIHVWVDIAT